MGNQNDKSEAIAVIGMSLNVPGADNLDEFWRNLCAGVESFGPMTDDDLSEVGFDHSARQNPHWVVVRGFPKRPKDFDASFFGIAPNDALLMDPQQRHLLECAQHAFDDAGYDPLAFNGDVGVWAGTGVSGYFYEFLDPAFKDDPQQQFASILLNDFHFPATRLAHTFNLTGPAINVATACSTGLVAAHYACQALRRHECDMALVAVSRINPSAYSGYPRMDGMIYSSDGHCRVFDSRADGTVFTNGTAIVLLKRLDRALEEGDNVRAVILGSAVNNDGNVKLSFTAPSSDGQESVLEEAYHDAGVDPASVTFVEGHGTGTLLGDPIEVNALTRVFRKHTDKRAFCHLGSVKSNIGHLEVAAGVAGLIKAVLALENREIPGTLHYQKANPALDIDNSPFVINPTLQPWNVQTTRRAGVSSFGIGGTNAHVVVEEAALPATTISSRRRHILPISAKTTKSRDQMVENLVQHLAAHPQLDIADVAYTLQLGRKAFPMRTALVVEEIGSIAAAAQKHAIVSTVAAPRGVGSVWMFPGQGSQYPGMCRGLYEEEAEFRQTFDYCAQKLAPLLGVDLREVVLDPSTAADVLEQTRITQPALFVVEYAMARQLQQWHIEPVALIGHSIGEYVAACLAGVFSLDDALELVAARGALIQALPRGSMLSVNAPEATLAPYIDDAVSLAAVNSPEHCVLSGAQQAIEDVAQRLRAAGISCRLLHTSHAFHSVMMEPALEPFRRRLEALTLQPPQIPFVSNVTGTWIEDEEATSADYWCRHLRGTVRFAAGLTAICESRPDDVFAELGPNTTLSQLAGLHEQARDRARIALGRHSKETRADGQLFAEGVARMWVAGVDVPWEELYTGETRRKVSLPGYAFQREEFFFSRFRQRGRRYEFHPLLGRMHRSAVARDEIVFDATISTWEPEFLLQHTIFDVPLVPAACYVETALAVGKQVLASDNVSVTDIVFQKPIPLRRDLQCQLQTIVTKQPDGALKVRLFSLPFTEGDQDRSLEWEENVTATVRAVPAQHRDASAELSAWRARCTVQVPHEELYDMERIGFRWGPAFQSVKQCFVGHWELLARIEIPKYVDAELRDFVFHPSLLDGCFQLVGRAVPLDRLPGMLMPAAADRISVYGPVPAQFWCYIKSRENELNAQGVTLDLQLVGDDGREFARIDRFLELVISQNTLLEAGARVRSWFHRIGWTRLDDAAIAAGAARMPLVIFADGDGLADQLARTAIEQGLPAPIMIFRDTLRSAAPEACECHEWSTATAEEISARLAALPAAAAMAVLWTTRPGEALDLTDDVLTLTQRAVSDAWKVKKFVVVTRGAQQTATEAIANVEQAAVWGLQRVIINEHAELNAAVIDLDAASTDRASDAQHVLSLLRADTKENQICIRGNELRAARLARMERQRGGAKGAFAVRLSSYGSLDSLSFEPLTPRKPKSSEVKIQVECSAVNFRDVLQTMGAMRAFNEAAGIHDPSQVPIGFECAGRVLEVGEAVTAFQPGDRVLAFGTGCHTSHYMADVSQVVSIPDRLDAADVVALPTVLVTALYGLDRLAAVKEGDRVLIHSCAGGVGQAALRIAQRAGAIVYATASPAKWEHLRSQGVAGVWSSRTLEFADGIMQATDGKGVDVVLNALNGEFIERSLSVLAPNGRFIEIGKVGAWTKQQMAQVRPDVDYFKFDLYEINPALFRSILEEGIGLVEDGSIAPLPVRRFAVRDITSAFRCLAQGQNVGKIVLEMPEDSQGVIRKDRSYLITGGLGGLGLVMAAGLAESGAQHLALIGRRAPNEAAQAEIERLRQAGVSVTVFQCDIGIRSEAEALFAQIDAQLPALGGVLHAAGVLDDGVVMKLDRARLATSMAPKVAGTVHLHELTKQRDLDFFVLFSSISATLGAAGQANYSAANAFMDAMASSRTAQGLPGLSIGWGAWAVTGMAADLVDRYRAQRAAMGLRDIPPAEGVIAVNTLLEHATAGHVVAMPVQWSRYLAQYLRSGAMPPLFLDVAGSLQVDGEGAGASSQEDVSLITEIRGADPATRMVILKGFIAKQAAATVGTEVASIDDATTLAEVGVDSLIAMELRTRINRSIGVELPLSVLVGASTIVDVATKIAEAFDGSLQRAA